MKRILHIMVGAGIYGGAEQFALSYYEKMDRSKVTFDILFLQSNVLKNKKLELLDDSRIDALETWKTKGNKVGNYIRTIKGVWSAIRKGDYEIVHVNSGIIKVQITCLFAAWLAGAKVRIAHSHTAKPAGNVDLESVGERIKTFAVRRLATDYFGCSECAGAYLFGKKGIRSNRFKVIPNAIDLSRYRFDTKKRNVACHVEQENKKPVFAHIGRFIQVKNQRFVIQVFREIRKQLPDACLWMVGDGELLDEIKDYACEVEVDDAVRFFGSRNDVPDLMQFMDALIFPSFHEGLSIVVVESQAAGMNVFVADTLSEEHRLSEHIHFLKLNVSPKVWAEFIVKEMKGYQKTSNQDKLLKAGYEIETAAEQLQKYYLEK